LIASPLGIKSWREQMPTCAEARPGSCACCGAAAQPIGGRLVIVGHGLVERQLLGPATAAGAPERRLVTLRRYRCRACTAILVVGPRGLVARRWYGSGAMALAFAAFSRGEASSSIRARISPTGIVGGSATERWITVQRWIEAARRGELFGVAALGTLERRGVAEHIVLALAARAGWMLGVDLAESAFDGAAIAA
jgi:hypothetical protein